MSKDTSSKQMMIWKLLNNAISKTMMSYGILKENLKN